MKRLARFLAFLSAFSGVLLLIHARGLVAGLLWVPKVMAGVLSPLLVVMGGAAVLFGRRRRDRLATWLGLLGAGLAVRHIIKVTAGHDGFEQAFGRGWEERITPAQQARMLSKRYRP